MEIDPKELKPSQAYDLITGLIVPRPIAFISTLSPDGIPNAAPFSFYNGISTNPPMLAVAIAQPGTEKKATMRNIEATGEFVVNGVDEDLAEGMNRASGNYPSDTNKFVGAGLTPVPSVKVKPPRIGEAPVSLECRVVQVVPLPETRDVLVIGRILHIYLRDDLIKKGTFDPGRFRAIGRLGQSSYCWIHEKFTLDKP